MTTGAMESGLVCMRNFYIMALQDLMLPDIGETGSKKPRLRRSHDDKNGSTDDSRLRTRSSHLNVERPVIVEF